jgi:NADPH:quinone reductase-like Zn-dependent oxidoreductase
MRAVVIGAEGTFGLQQRPDPVAGPGEVVIRVRAAGLRRRGRLLMVGMLAPPPAAVPPLWLGALMLNRCQLIGTTIRGRTNGEKAILARDMATAVPLLAEGRLRVPVDSVFPLERCSDAYHRLASPGKLGKIILTTELPPL